MAVDKATEVARELIRRAPNRRWLRELTDLLDREVRAEPLQRIRSLWGLNNANLGRIFGVTRQAVTSWFDDGVPVGRAETIATIAAATDILDRKLKRERIPAVVRRPSERLGGRSLLQLAEAGRHREVLEAVREIFDLRRVQP
ncbi:MAG: hypothetical protein RQ745_07975 [Longimicrobiales bacterium]|nr:hypothetical protein [Longimicrobiales bacterium]